MQEKQGAVVGAQYGHDLAVALGFAQGHTPCAATF